MHSYITHFMVKASCSYTERYEYLAIARELVS